MSEINAIPLQSAEIRSGEKLLTITYFLYMLSIFMGGVPAIIALIIDYIKQADYQGTYLGSHFGYQIRTFWIGFVLTIISFILMFAAGLGIFILGPSFIWYIYRNVKGFLRLNDKKEI